MRETGVRSVKEELHLAELHEDDELVLYLDERVPGHDASQVLSVNYLTSPPLSAPHDHYQVLDLFLASNQ